MAQRKASSTMIRSSLMRAVHQVLDADPKILDDPLAVGLVEGSSREEILAATPDSWPPSWFRSIFPLRSRYTEDSLAEAVAKGIGQYVLLGAGMDTFALPPTDLGGKASHFRDRPSREPEDRARSGQTRHRGSRQRGVRANRLRAPIAGRGSRRVLAGPSRAGVIFVAWGYTVLTREAIDSTLRYVLSMPRRSESGDGVHRSSGFMDAGRSRLSDNGSASGGRYR